MPTHLTAPVYSFAKSRGFKNDLLIDGFGNKLEIFIRGGEVDWLNL